MTVATIGEIVVYLPWDRPMRVHGTSRARGDLLCLNVAELHHGSDMAFWVRADDCRAACPGDVPAQ